MMANDEFLEYACYVSHSYGTPKAYVEQKLNEGKDVILEIEIQGALKVKAKRPDTLLVFVTPPSAEELEKRLVGRGTETPEVIQSRMRRAVEEAGSMELYDYIVINDTVEECVDELHKLIRSQHNQVSHQKEFISRIQKELTEREEINK